MSWTLNQRWVEASFTQTEGSVEVRSTVAAKLKERHYCNIIMMVMFVFVSSAAGAVCPECLHPVGAEPGGLGVQTLLPASAGPS